MQRKKRLVFHTSSVTPSLAYVFCVIVGVLLATTFITGLARQVKAPTAWVSLLTPSNSTVLLPPLGAEVLLLPCESVMSTGDPWFWIMKLLMTPS